MASPRDAAWVAATAADLQRQWTARWTAQQQQQQQQQRRPARRTRAPGAAPAPSASASSSSSSASASASEAAFRSRLAALVQQVRQYEEPAMQAEARAVIPHDRIAAGARKYMAVHGLDASHLTEATLRQLLRWFKDSFFQWVNTPPCDACGDHASGGAMAGIPPALQGAGPIGPDGTDMEGKEAAKPTDEERRYGAHRVEAYRCRSCGATTRFPRYNHPGKLLQTRRGRCGEWANCFTLCCRAMGWEARLVMDWTDHVWTEVYSDRQSRWLHCDACEPGMDTPLLYETGWGKKLTYVIAFSAAEAVDVIARYTNHYTDVLQRRTLVSEAWLVAELGRINHALRAKIARTPAVLSTLSRRQMAEALELTGFKSRHRDVLPEETGGRVSGSVEWRAARHELGDAVAVAAAPKRTAGPWPTGVDMWPRWAVDTSSLRLDRAAALDPRPDALWVTLTPARNDCVGSAFVVARQPILNGIAIRFQFRVGRDGRDGADGFALVLHRDPAGLNAQGLPGAQLGYGGLRNSLAVEFDCYTNRDSTADPDGPHISVQSCGKEPNTAHHDESLACVTGSAVPPFTNGQVYHAAVVYDAVARRLTVGLAPGPLATMLPPPLLSADVDLPALLDLGDDGAAFIGFTAATGGLNESHEVGAWSIAAAPAP